MTSSIYVKAAPYSFANMLANFSLTFLTSSGLALATGGKSFKRSNGRQASITARELVELGLSRRDQEACSKRGG